MIRVPVNSTNILSIGYDQTSQMLEVEFKTKRVYRYSNVPPHVYAGLMKAASHGKYLQTRIANTFSSVEVR
jgi:hypothetical protein